MSARHRARVASLLLAVALLVAYGVMRVLEHRARDREVRAGFVSRSSDTAFEIEPHLAMSGSGPLGVAWMGVRAGASAADRIGVRFSVDNGKSWGAIQTMHLPGFFAADPMLVARASGEMDLTWLAFRQNIAAGGEPYEMHVYAARARGGGLSSAVEVSEGAAIYDKPFAILDGKRRLRVLYRFATATEGGFALATGDDAGAHFTRVLVARGPGFAGALGSICAEQDGSRAFVTYLDPTLGIVLRASDDGLDWPVARQTIVSTSDEPVALEGPLCFVNDGELIVTYGTSAEPADTGASALLSALVVARSKDGGKTVASRTVLREEHALLMHPQLVLERTNLQMVYFSGRLAGDDGGSLRVRRAAEGIALSRILRSPVRFVARRSDPAWMGDYIGLAASRGRLYATTVDNAEGIPHVVFTEAAFDE